VSNYTINERLIPLPKSHQDPLIATLEMYDRGEDLSNSPLIQSGISALHIDGKDRIGDKNVLIERQSAFIALYESIKKDGFKVLPPFFGYFDEGGQVRLYDGFHRLAIIRHLKLNVDVVLSTDWKGVDGTIGKDFPLVEVLEKESPIGKALYQPIDDPRFKDWYIDRPDSQKRLDHILSQLTGKTVLDIGCSEGYFARELTKRGYKVTAIDHSKGLVAAARYLTIVNNLEVTYKCGDWYDIVQELGEFDNILLLSVVHNDAKFIGLGRALQRLWAINRKCKRLIMEVPNNDNEHQWNKPNWPSWDFHNLENIERLEILTGMSCVRDYLGTRSIFTFSSEPSDIIAVDMAQGFPMLCSKKERFITNTMLGWHDWETQTTQFINENLKKGQVFVDVGANGGYFTVLASRIVGNDGLVHAFEPASDTYELLLKNTKGLSNVITHNVALSDRSGKAHFYGGPNTGQRGLISSQITGTDVLQQVEIAALDSFGLKPDMIKIDTEGNEPDVIKGAEKSISDSTILIVENGSNIKGFSVIDHSTNWRPFNYYLIKGDIPTAYHLLGLAHTKSNKDYIPCAITQNVVKLGKMLTKLGYTSFHYGAEGSDLECTEHIECISDKEQFALYGDRWKNGFFEYNKNDAVYQKFNARAIEEINKRKGPRDILLIFNGNAQKEIADKVKLMTVEASIGYEGVFCNKRVFESYGWMQYIYGALNHGSSAPDGNFYDAVIPLAVDPDDFVYRKKKGDYFLYAGRIIKRKGVHIAQQVCDKLGVKLIIIGQGSLEGVVDVSKNIEHIGVVSTKERAKLMAGAKALFAPTIYIEPFGAIVPEANMSGTPVITTDWGAFPETVVHGVTGYRCRTFDDFVWAAKNIDTIKPENCRKHAMNYSLDKIGLMYEEYFKKIRDLFVGGWYEEHPERANLAWLEKLCP